MVFGQLSKAPVSVLILTFNEESNLPYALHSIAGWADQIVVVDSYSTDRTVEIARSYGADVYQNPFENFVQQRNWALTVPEYRNEWVLYIDADEQVTPELRAEIAEVLSTVPDDVAGFEMRRRFIFMGRWLRHGGYHIWLLRLFRRNRCRFVPSHQGGEYPVVEGKVWRLRYDLLHQDHRPLAQWIQNQNKDSTKVALALFEAGGRPIQAGLNPGEAIEGGMRTWLNRHIYARIPFWAKPIARFLTFYLLRGGFLDGWQGFAYCALHEFWYPLLVSLKLRELQTSEIARTHAEQSGWR